MVKTPPLSQPPLTHARPHGPAALNQKNPVEKPYAFLNQFTISASVPDQKMSAALFTGVASLKARRLLFKIAETESQD